MKKISFTSIYFLILLSFCSKSFGQVLNKEKSFNGFEKFAKKIEPKATWENLKLPENEIATIKEAIISFKKISDSNKTNKLPAESLIESGISVLLNGENKSGKTLTAEIIAKKTGRDVYRIDLSLVVSKYIGETEKNLGKIFDKAENKNWILFFDEADALFGKRSKLGKKQNYYTNREVTYFLHRVEFYQGLTIIASTSKSKFK